MNRISRVFRSLASLALTAVSAASAIAATSCAPDPMPFDPGETKVFAGGVEVNGAALNLGYQSYTRYCYACHGELGDGKGPASYSLRPPPRDFTKGIFKFARLRSSDDLPPDEDLVRIVKGGLHGSAMLPWDVPDEELSRILQYIKTFAPQRWEKKKKSGEPIKTIEPFAPEADPWIGKEAEAETVGEELYHLRAECLNCHPSFLGKKDLYELSKKAAERSPDKFKPIGGYRSDPHGSVAKDSPEYGVKILPPDFTMHPVRSATSPNKVEDLYRILSFGVYPIMPAWKGAGLTDAEIWAMAHYVKSLMDLRDTPKAMEMKAEFESQLGFEIPKPVEPPPEVAPEAPKEGDADKKDDKGAKKDDKGAKKDKAAK